MKKFRKTKQIGITVGAFITVIIFLSCNVHAAGSGAGAPSGGPFGDPYWEYYYTTTNDDGMEVYSIEYREDEENSLVRYIYDESTPWIYVDLNGDDPPAEVRVELEDDDMCGGYPTYDDSGYYRDVEAKYEINVQGNAIYVTICHKFYEPGYESSVWGDHGIYVRLDPVPPAEYLPIAIYEIPIRIDDQITDYYNRVSQSLDPVTWIEQEIEAQWTMKDMETVGIHILKLWDGDDNEAILLRQRHSSYASVDAQIYVIDDGNDENDPGDYLNEEDIHDNDNYFWFKDVREVTLPSTPYLRSGIGLDFVADP